MMIVQGDRVCCHLITGVICRRQNYVAQFHLCLNTQALWIKTNYLLRNVCTIFVEAARRRQLQLKITRWKTTFTSNILVAPPKVFSVFFLEKEEIATQV